jgi:hypothetical protein
MTVQFGESFVDSKSRFVRHSVAFVDTLSPSSAGEWPTTSKPRGLPGGRLLSPHRFGLAAGH